MIWKVVGWLLAVILGFVLLAMIFVGISMGVEAVKPWF